MFSHSLTTRGPPSDVIPSQAPPIVIFELNQARRAKVTRELEAVRSGMQPIAEAIPAEAVAPASPVPQSDALVALTLLQYASASGELATLGLAGCSPGFILQVLKR